MAFADDIRRAALGFAILLAAGVSQATVAAAVKDAVVLVEAESFSDLGGWVVDPQFMDQMGSPYLLAHGLGRPVADAVTEVDLPAAGNFRIWVRTKDWVARWNAPGGPGRFQVLIDGRALGTEFGIEGAEWHWQDGGCHDIANRRVRIALHDLMGFEGRCDAILFAADPRFVPPNVDPQMGEFRRNCLGQPDVPEAVGEFDLVVAGGGIAGTCAALSAARLGLTVALVQDRPVLGGNNSSEVRVWLQGGRNKEPWPRVGDVVAELEQTNRAHYGPSNTAALYEDEKKLAIVRAESNIRLFLEHRANAVQTEGGRIRAVIARHIRTGQRARIAGRWFADCTGDAVVGSLAGADFEMEPKGHMGPCNLWNVCECTDTNAINTAVAATAEPQPFPRCPWALDLSDKPFPGRSKTKPNTLALGGWYWESGFDRDPILEMEYIRDWNFRAMYGAWDAMKNIDGVLPNHRLNWAAYILGKRESRRLMGDVVLSFEDLTSDRQFDDGCVPTGWSNDLHLPDPKYEKGFEGDAFISRADFGHFPAIRERRPFWIPYRCLYSRNILNLFMAGRDISTKHDALGAVRVMRTGGCMGEIVGMAAGICKEHGCDPRDIYADHLAELKELMRVGVGKNPGANPEYENGAEPRRKAAGGTPAVQKMPAWRSRAGRNLALDASITVPDGAGGRRQATELNDGLANVADNGGRWLGKGPMPHMVELEWTRPVTVGAVRIVSGYFDGSVSAPVADFNLQWHDGSGWRDIPGGAARDNADPYYAVIFAPVQTARLRLCIHGSKGGVSRIWEIECFGAVEETAGAR